MFYDKYFTTCISIHFFKGQLISNLPVAEVTGISKLFREKNHKSHFLNSKAEHYNSS